MSQNGFVCSPYTLNGVPWLFHEKLFNVNFFRRRKSIILHIGKVEDSIAFCFEKILDFAVYIDKLNLANLVGKGMK